VRELRWKDLELESVEPQLRVRRAFPDRANKPGPPKSDYSRRKLPLPVTLASDLRQYRVKGTDWFAPDDLVFTDGKGGHLRHGNVRRRVLLPLAKSARVDFKGIGFHTFRHTCATVLFDAGRNPVQVQRFLGHHDPAFTMKTYVHLLNEDLGGALDEGQGVTRVSPQATDTARNDTQSKVAIPH
jgi:integrase